MKDFQYTAPNTVEDATRLLSEHGSRAKILAGGTDIIVQLREGMCEADVVVDIKKIPELVQYQYASDSGLTLGAAVSCCNLYEDSQLADLYGALADSSRIIGGWQIQSRASVGGNLCNASPAADCIPALIALNATAHITGSFREILEKGNINVQFRQLKGNDIDAACGQLRRKTLPSP